MGYTMLTYQMGMSTIGLVDAVPAWGIARKRLKERIKKAQQSNSSFFRFLVGEGRTVLLNVDRFKFFNCLAAEFHAVSA